MLKLHPFRPFWLSPRQAAVIPVSSQYDGFAKKVGEQLVLVKAKNDSFRVHSLREILAVVCSQFASYYPDDVIASC